MNKDLDERRLLLQTLGLKLYVKLIFPQQGFPVTAGSVVECLNWDERQGKVFVLAPNGKKYWVSGSAFEKL